EKSGLDNFGRLPIISALEYMGGRDIRAGRRACYLRYANHVRVPAPEPRSKHLELGRKLAVLGLFLGGENRFTQVFGGGFGLHILFSQRLKTIGRIDIALGVG